MATPPTFSAGAVLTAAQMNAVGLWLIKTETIGSAVASVQVTGAFSADFDNYLITVTGGVSSVACDLKLTFGATATGYAYGLIYNLYGTATATVVTSTNTTSFPYGGAGSANTLDAYVAVRSPYDAKYTVVSSNYVASVTAGAQGVMQGFLANTTSYTAFTFTPSSGTLTGGTIRVYGYRD